MPNGAAGTNQPPSPLPMSLVGVVMPIGALNWASASCGAQLSFYLGIIQGLANKININNKYSVLIGSLVSALTPDGGRFAQI